MGRGPESYLYYTLWDEVARFGRDLYFRHPDRVTVQTLISRRSPAASSDEKYTLNDRFQNRVYDFEGSGVRSDEKIYIERLIRKSCL